MTWTIYSIGDMAFLQKVLQGVAMLCGGNDYVMSAQIATAIGVVVLVFRGIAGGGASIRFHEVFVGFLLYSMIFVAKVTVNIQSVATGAVVQQANVPVGFAAAGSVVSLLGMELTQDMEQAFSTPTMMQNGFQSSLNTIRIVRTNTMSVSGFGAANAPVAGSDVYSSWVNYINECTIPMIELNQLSVPALLSNPSFITVLQFNNTVKNVLVFTANGPVTESCQAGYTDLLNFSMGSFIPALLGQLAAPLGGTAGSADYATTTIANALNGVGLGMADVPSFVLTSVLVPIFYDTVAQSAESSYSSSFATMISDAERNRAAQWMGQSSLFNLYVQPMLAFIEGFQYAMMPLVLLFVLLGTSAIRVAGKFLGGLLWIQLWYPLLAIVNLYEQMALTGSMTAMIGAGNGALSLAGTLQSDQSFLAWMSIGGLMASSVPALAAGVAYGAWNGVDALVGRIGGPENIMSEVAAPREIGQQYSRYAFAPMRTQTPTLGMHDTGSEAIVPTMTFSSGNSNRLESARLEAETASNDFRSKLARSIGTNAATENRGGESGSVSDRHVASYGAGVTTTRSDAATVSSQVSDAAGRSQILTGGVSGQANGSAGVGKGGGTGASIGGGGNLSSTESLEASKRASREQAIQRVLREEPSLQANDLKEIATDLRTNRERSVFASKNEHEQRDLEQSAAHLLSATENYQQAATSQVNSGASLTVSSQAAVAAIRKSPVLREGLTSAVARHGLGAEAKRLTNFNGRQWRNFYGDATGAEIMGQLSALGAFDVAHAGGADTESLSRRADYNRILDGAVGADTPVLTGEARNEGRIGQLMPVARSLPDAGSVTSQVTAGLDASGQTVAGGNAAVAAGDAQHRTQQKEDGARLAQPVAESLRKTDAAQGAADTATTVAEEAKGLYGRVKRFIGDEGRGAGNALAPPVNEADSAARHVQDRVLAYQQKAETSGLTKLQAQYVAINAVGGSTYPQRDRVLDDLRGRVGAEATSAGLDAKQIVARLDAIATAPDDGGAELRLKDLGRTNELARLTEATIPKGGSLDDALRRRAGP